MSIDSAESTGNPWRHDPPSPMRQPAVECAGCRERSARIEQLERRIKALIPIGLYGAIAVLGLMASPVFTFAMMRAANYRLIHP